jgi:hypothetical protein
VIIGKTFVFLIFSVARNFMEQVHLVIEFWARLCSGHLYRIWPWSPCPRRFLQT